MSTGAKIFVIFAGLLFIYLILDRYNKTMEAKRKEEEYREKTACDFISVETWNDKKLVLKDQILDREWTSWYANGNADTPFIIKYRDAAIAADFHGGNGVVEPADIIVFGAWGEAHDTLLAEGYCEHLT